MASDSPTVQAFRRHPIVLSLGCVIGILIIALFVASFFLDDIVRTRTQNAMNQKLTGYHVSLEHAHLQLLGGILTLSELKVIQQAHPSPPVAVFPMMRFSVQVEELLSRHVVADVLLHRPKIHIDQTQFVAEKNSKTPMRQEGWQDALEAAYPFKINRFTIDHGDVVYIQDASTKPLHLADLDFTADNIRNIHEPENDYPSRFHARLVIFDQGRATVDGHANFLEEPFPGARAKYTISNVPLSAFDPEIRQLNVSVTGGHLSSDGLVEYSPKITRVDVNDASVEGVGVDYVHLPQTQKQEAQRVKEAGKAVEEQNNRPAVDITVREFDIGHSNFAYEDKIANPNYKLFFNDADMTIKNLANHQQQGPADLSLHGKFMGTGDSSVAGDFLASNPGPAFNLKVAIQNTDLTSLNDLMRAYGRFDVAAGKLSVYSQVGIKDGNIDGYVKPMFSDLQVYDYQKDKNKPILHQAKELAIGGASHLFKNHRTEQVATDVDLKGKLSSPDISTWQALGQVLRNAFVQAIIPGFDRAVASNNTANATKQANAH
jgi:Domain of Unknown Function (DUF748)